MPWRSRRDSYLDTNLLVYCLLLVLDLLLELPEFRAVGCRAIRLQHLDVPGVCQLPAPSNSLSEHVLIGERCDLLLLDLVVGEVLLVLLPARARGAGHVCGTRGMALAANMLQILCEGGCGEMTQGESGEKAAGDVVVDGGRGVAVIADTKLVMSAVGELSHRLRARVEIVESSETAQRAFTPRYPSFCLCLPPTTQDGRTSRKWWQWKCSVQGAEHWFGALKTLTDAACRTRRSPELFAAPTSLPHEV